MFNRISWKQRGMRALLIAAAGALVAVNILYHDIRFAREVSFVRCATVGAFLSGLIWADLIGRAGRKGWVLAVVGFVAATLTGALLAVAVMPIDHLFFENSDADFVRRNMDLSLFGPIFVATAIVQAANVTVAWLVGLTGVHLIARRLTCP